ncbi:PRTRC system protein E [Ralstonia pseudosolanacearum]|uniref:PRTRC system protein E n=1 Tax=Ralstonia pseudosolanacearum TaxID=1310165 RepID=UPI0026FAB9E0|nr:PRTRC system protein E [Ralstonia pseudosolanacearum]MDO3615393.1 PRTRC system protein E [Ralstonia pseudosolanacearum]
MFQELVPLVKASDKVVITLSMKGDDMTVVVAPTVSKPDDAALVAPIALTATPAELDAEFANAIGGVTQARQGLAEQVESTKAVIQAATVAQSNKATKALAKSNRTNPKLPAPKSEGTDDDDVTDVEATETSSGATGASAAGAQGGEKSSGTSLADLLG